MSDIDTTCGYCGRTEQVLVQFNQGERSSLLCPHCVEKKEAASKLALAIVDGTAPSTIADFGEAQDLAVKLAASAFPATFRLRNHEGTFRVNARNSYVSRGRVVLYTDKLRTTQVQNGPSRGQYQDEWVDFAKGSISELKSQVVR